MSGNRQQTMAKLARERAVREKRERKAEKKRQRKLAASGELPATDEDAPAENGEQSAQPL